MTNYDPRLLGRFSAKPHSFQSVATPSSDVTAGAPVVEESRAPAHIEAALQPWQFDTAADAATICGDVDQSPTDDSHRPSARAACDATVDASPSSAPFFTVRHKRTGYMGDCLGYGKHLPRYRVRWHEPWGDGATVYEMDCNDFEIVPDENALDLRAALICSDMLSTLEKLSADFAKLKQRAGEDR